MSALTYEIKDPRSPVAVWLRTTFPHFKEVQAALRRAAGTARILPSEAVAAGTQGAAIEWLLRMLVDPAPSLDLPLEGLRRRWHLPYRDAGLALLLQLDGGGQSGTGVPRSVRPIDVRRLAQQSDEWRARAAYALALLVELFRAYSVEKSRLMRLHPDSDVDDLLGLANDDEVADMLAVRDLAVQQLLLRLPSGPLVTGMTFDGSADLAGDADLIAGGMLVDIKTGRGGNPRRDGTPAARLVRAEIDQILGYALMDYSDTYRLETVAIYLARFGYLAAWPLDHLIHQLSGRQIPLPALRREFAKVLQVDLPAYWRKVEADPGS
jgi:hypothetical protein